MGAAVAPTPASAKPEGTRAAKIRLLERLKVAPDLMIFGSSRAMKADPQVVRRLTRSRGFNASVSSGTPADTWSFMFLEHDLFPEKQARYLWILDMEQLRRARIHPKTLTVPRLVAYLPEEYRPHKRAATVPEPRAEAAASDDEALGGTWSEAGSSARSKSYGRHMVFRSDGYSVWGMRDYWASQGYTLAACLQSTILHFNAIYPKGFGAIRSTPAFFVRKTIAQMNAWGIRPVIVLSPYHPDLRRYIGDRGWSQRHREVRRFFRHLQRRLDFVLLDYTSIQSFGGKASGFFDGIHPRRSLMARILKAAVRRARKQLVPVPKPTPTPTPTATPTPTPTESPTVEPSPTPTTSPSPTSSPRVGAPHVVVLGSCGAIPVWRRAMPVTRAAAPASRPVVPSPQPIF